MIGIPDISRTNVLSSGTSRGLRGAILTGGYQPSKSCVGTSLEW